MHHINTLHLGRWVKFYALSFVVLLSVFHTVHIIIMTVEIPPIDIASVMLHFFLHMPYVYYKR